MKAQQRSELMTVLRDRFEKNVQRHHGLTWGRVEAALKGKAAKLESLSQMESTGGEPDVVLLNADSDEIAFVDCASETPSGRRSVCYDREGLESRKEHKPQSSAVEMAEAMGIVLLDEQQYRSLQLLGEFDTKTSSWLSTPVDIRKLGGALFGDRRYDTVFVYHNGAQSYYAGRGFRGLLRV